MNNSQELSKNAYPSASVFNEQAVFEPVVEDSAVEEPAVAQPAVEISAESAPPTTTLLPASYPSADSATTALIPATPRKSAGSLRSSLKSFVSADQSLTKPVRGVARLAQNQFAFNAHLQRQSRLREKEEAHQVLNLALRIAEGLFQFGADTQDVDSAIVSVCAAYGLDDVELDITNQSVLINYVRELEHTDTTTQALDSAATQERESYTVMRVVRSWSENYAALGELYQLISDITQKHLTRRRADKRLDAIMMMKKPYSRLALMGANFLTAVSLTLALGGSWGAGLCAGLAFMLIYLVNFSISLLKMPGFFTMVTGSALITFSGLYIANKDSIFASLSGSWGAQYIVAAGLIILLPTSRMVSTIQDALTGFPLTAAGKFVSTGVLLLGIVVGFSSALTFLHLLGYSAFNVQEAVFDPSITWKGFLFMVIASVAVGMSYLARWQNLMWVVLVSTAGIWVYNGVGILTGDEQRRTATFVSAVVVGMLSTYLARKLNTPASSFYVPSLTFLLPGLAFFRGMYLLVMQEQGIAGLPSLVMAVIVILSMASGVVLGSALMQYLMQKFMKPDADEVSPMTQMMSTLNR